MDSFALLAYASLTASRTLLQRLLACLNFALDSEDLSFWCKLKKWFLRTMAAAQAAENHGDEWGLSGYLRWGIYTSIPTWSHSQNSRGATSTEFKDILPWNISQMMRKTVLIRIVISYAMKRGIPLWIWSKVNGNWDSNIRISQWSESHCRTNTSVRRKKEIQKNRTVRITAWDASRKVNHLSKVVWDRKIIT